MESHPIPQDITGFQFRLIGDMTVKQFAYVAVGVAGAWFIYSLPVFGVIKIPIAAVFALFGAGFAFLPVSGRPMDVMALNFMKALFSSSKYMYQKSAVQAPIPQTTTTPTPITFVPIQQPVVTPPQEKKPEIPQEPSYAVPFIVTQQTQNPAPMPTTPAPIAAEPEQKEQELEKKEETIETQLQEVKVQETQATNTPTFEQVHQKVLDLEKLLADTTAQRQELERQILELHQKIENQNKKTFVPSPEPQKETQNVKNVPANMRKAVGAPIAPEFPNLLTGIVKDPRGNPIPNILVEVRDRDGNPVRALKTNGLGQFSAATPLTNGVYDIFFEDPRGQGKFDTIEIKATGEIIMPLEIISEDAREELRKALFS